MYTDVAAQLLELVVQRAAGRALLHVPTVPVCDGDASPCTSERRWSTLSSRGAAAQVRASSRRRCGTFRHVLIVRERIAQR